MSADQPDTTDPLMDALDTVDADPALQAQREAAWKERMSKPETTRDGACHICGHDLAGHGAPTCSAWHAADHPSTNLFGTSEDVELARRLWSALGHDTAPGECQDCGGVGNVPSIEATAEAGRSLWRTCPTCRGGGKGGAA